MNSNLKLRHTQFGIKQGNFNPSNQTQDQFLFQIEKAKQLLPVSVVKVFAPSVGFTNKLSTLGKDDNILTPWLIRTNNKADAGMITGAGIAIAFFNGDCPIICLYQGDRLAVLHAGYRCLIRKNKEEPNIIEEAMQHFDHHRVRVWAGFGIGSCCWLPEEDKAEIKEPEKSRDPELLKFCLRKTTIASPFGRGNLTVDLYGLIEGLLLQQGILRKNIKINKQCACCAVEYGKLAFWSHTRFLAEAGIDGRNLSAAWLE